MIGQPARSGHQSTSFLAGAREYGLRQLLVTSGTICAAGPAALVGLLVGLGAIGPGGLSALGLGLVICATAVFVVVLAVLCLGSMIFDRYYAAELDQMGVLRPMLFAIWWTAALAGSAVVGAIALVVAAGSAAPLALLALSSGCAVFLMLAGLLETLALGGTIMRHSLYRALVAGEREGPATFLG